MAILVDEPIWDWRGRKWAHLVTDTDLDELHQFAHRLGLPYLAFQGDHYDIHTDLRLRALADGAHAVTGREIVVALRQSGLRRRGGLEPWRWEWRGAASDPAVSTIGVEAADLQETIGALDGGGEFVEVAVVSRTEERLVVVSTASAVRIDSGLTVVDERTSVHRSSGERGTYVEFRSLLG